MVGRWPCAATGVSAAGCVQAVGRRLAAADGRGMIATPLVPAGRAAALLRSVVVGGLFGTTPAGAAALGRRPRRGAAVAVAAATTAVEHVGTRTGCPFGRYRYTGALRPRSPACRSSCRWHGWRWRCRRARRPRRARPRSRPAPAHRAGRRGADRVGPVPRSADGRRGYWQWTGRGRYRGIPLTNYAGWLLTAAAVMALLEVVLPPQGEPSACWSASTADGCDGDARLRRFFRDRCGGRRRRRGMLPLAAWLPAASPASAGRG